MNQFCFSLFCINFEFPCKKWLNQAHTIKRLYNFFFDHFFCFFFLLFEQMGGGLQKIWTDTKYTTFRLFYLFLFVMHKIKLDFHLVCECLWINTFAQLSQHFFHRLISDWVYRKVLKKLLNFQTYISEKKFNNCFIFHDAFEIMVEFTHFRKCQIRLYSLELFFRLCWKIFQFSCKNWGARKTNKNNLNHTTRTFSSAVIESKKKLWTTVLYNIITVYYMYACVNSSHKFIVKSHFPHNFPFYSNNTFSLVSVNCCYYTYCKSFRHFVFISFYS